MIRFFAGAITGIFIAYIIGVGLDTCERKIQHSIAKPDWRDVMYSAYR